PPPTPPHARRSYRYYDLVMASFVTVLLCANLIGPGKVCIVAGIAFGAGNLFFPLSYIFGDVLTEVYGYARTRKVIWAGFAAMLFATFMSQVVIRMPAAPTEYNAHYQTSLEDVFGGTWRIVLASVLAFWAGEFANSFVLAKMKVLTRGKHLWARTIGSTLVGQTIDSLLFYPIAFWGIWSADTPLVMVMLANLAVKVGWEALSTPLTYWIVGTLKRAEHEDFYDTDTNFTPFSLRD
ncbi:MAG: queuosine precursor transporter, partial [Myxococcales bacterium]|nr:queuosine precursor transporter [Myxococcales bacterium]